VIRLALLTSERIAAAAIEQMLQESGLFELVYCGPAEAPTEAELRGLGGAEPDVVLLHLNNAESLAWSGVNIGATDQRTALIGFCEEWSAGQRSFEEAGFTELLREPFSLLDLEKAAYRAIHHQQPLEHENILAFLPSKAGSGCSTVALNTAAALANDQNRRTLLVEADRRSGVLSILLDVEPRGGLVGVLEQSTAFTGLQWSRNVVSAGKLDLLMAAPSKPGPPPGWMSYHRMLFFAQKQYDFIVVDLPEAANPATMELLHAAQRVFIVCEPEVTSLKLVPLRRAELESQGISAEKICILVNRWESAHLKKEDVAQVCGMPMFAALPNDYRNVSDAVVGSRMVSRNSPFGKACAEFAGRLTKKPEMEPQGAMAGLLRRFGRAS